MLKSIYNNYKDYNNKEIHKLILNKIYYIQWIKINNNISIKLIKY